MSTIALLSHHAKRELHPKFVGDPTFQSELHRRVDAFFHTTGKRKRDCPSMYVKSAVLLAVFYGLYVLLAFVSQEWWQAVPLAILLGLATAAIGLNIQHDGAHHGYSKHPWINTLASMSLELVGGSSYVWHYRHNVLHHTYVNIADHDTDIDLGFFGRVSPHQQHRCFHRWQHYYVWPLYGFMALRWHLVGDVVDVVRGKAGVHPIQRPRGRDLLLFLLGKAYFFALAFGFPMLVHHWYVVLMYYTMTAMVVGVTLSIVFQLAHVVEEAEFVAPTDANRIENAWAIHQVQSTVNFSRRSRLATLLLGGLNFQIEHHLFPRICHVHYPAMSKIVEQTCREFGVAYNEHRSFLAGIVSHFRWLRRMGRPPVSQMA